MRIPGRVDLTVCRDAAVIYLSLQRRSKKKISLPGESVPNFNSKEMNCVVCGKRMFYSKENLVHVCLEEAHGVLCFFEPDNCWFAASEKTSLDMAKRGIKFHFIPKQVFENANIQLDFKCEYEDTRKSGSEPFRSGYQDL